MNTINELIEDCSNAIKALGKDNSPEALGIAQMKVLNALTKAENLAISDVSARLSSSLGLCLDGNDYEIVANKDGRFWINHKVVGSGEPLVQWIDSVLNVR